MVLWMPKHFILLLKITYSHLCFLHLLSVFFIINIISIGIKYFLWPDIDVSSFSLCILFLSIFKDIPFLLRILMGYLSIFETKLTILCTLSPLLHCLLTLLEMLCKSLIHLFVYCISYDVVSDIHYIFVWLNSLLLYLLILISRAFVFLSKHLRMSFNFTQSTIIRISFSR